MVYYFMQKQSPGCKRCAKCCTVLCGVFVALFLVLSASILSPGLSSSYPFHAQCQLQWSWTNTNCTSIHASLLTQVKMWKGPENCKDGGEKCLYDLISDEPGRMELQHTTPIRHFVDSITFSFCDRTKENCAADASQMKIKLAKRSVDTMEQATGCLVSGFSKSQVWYAILDYGTNYCNMRNLADGAGISKRKDFVQTTNDDVCTQYSSADCSVY